VLPLSVQAVLFLLGFLSLASPIWPILVGLIAPLVLIVGAYELGLFFFYWHKRRAANEF
jgi:hypothetical protein